MQFYARKRRQPPAVIIVALIDILIVLLIFLMVTTTFKQQPALKLALPESSQAQKTGANEAPPLVISIDPKGNLRLGFARGFTQSQAFVNHFGKNALIRPKTPDLLFDTSQLSGTNAQGAFVINGVVPGSPAEGAGLRAGDWISEVDGEKTVVTAQKEIVLRCGKASITLTRAGKVLIRGAYLLSRSSGVNRIKGGSVQIN